jgi:hypothetical protein
MLSLDFFKIRKDIESSIRSTFPAFKGGVCFVSRLATAYCRLVTAYFFPKVLEMPMLNWLACPDSPMS